MYQLVRAISFARSLFTRSFTDRLHLVFQVQHQYIVYWIHSLIFQYFSSSSLLLWLVVCIYIANKNVIIVYKSAVFFKWNKNLNRNGRNYWIQNVCIIKKCWIFAPYPICTQFILFYKWDLLFGMKVQGILYLCTHIARLLIKFEVAHNASHGNFMWMFICIYKDFSWNKMAWKGIETMVISNLFNYKLKIGFELKWLVAVCSHIQY